MLQLELQETAGFCFKGSQHFSAYVENIVQGAIQLSSFFSMITSGIMFVKYFVKFQVPLSKDKLDHWNLPRFFLTWLLKLFIH